MLKIEFLQGGGEVLTFCQFLKTIKNIYVDIVQGLCYIFWRFLQELKSILWKMIKINFSQIWKYWNKIVSKCTDTKKSLPKFWKSATFSAIYLNRWGVFLQKCRFWLIFYLNFNHSCHWCKFIIKMERAGNIFGNHLI